MRLTRMLLLCCLTAGIASCKSSTTSSNAPTQPPPDDSATTDNEKLQGTWTVISLHDEGKPRVEAKGLKIKFDGDQIVFADEMQSIAPVNRQAVRVSTNSTFKLDPTKSPRYIDIVADREPKVLQGIYELDGDNLRLALATYREIIYPPGPGTPPKKEIEKGERPTAFAGKRTEVYVLKRGEVAVSTNEESYRKLVVGVWRGHSYSSGAFTTLGLNDFTAEGKFRIKHGDKDPWQDYGKYEIKGDYILATVPEPVFGSKDKPFDPKAPIRYEDRDHKYPIRVLNETTFETDYFRLERVK
jgi:uncharacterized protein (TIGR03067 family)